MRKIKLTAIMLIFAVLCAAGVLAACSPNNHTHTIEFVEREATCTEQGLVAHYECVGTDGCGKFFADAEGLTEIKIDDIEHTDALGHFGGDAKCNALAVCSRCEQEYGEYGEHNYTGGLVKDEEYHWIGCINCGEIKEGEEKVAHTYTKKAVAEKFVKAPANCQNGPEYYLTCVCEAFDENSTDGFRFGKPDPDNHDKGWLFDETQHWYGCRIAGCTEPKERVAAHRISSKYTVTETGHYQACSGCAIHKNEGAHSYTVESTADAFAIVKRDCQHAGKYHKSCLCGSFETNGATFDTEKGEHELTYTHDASTHSAVCKYGDYTVAATSHTWDTAAKLKDANRVFNEDYVITINDLDVVQKCECGEEHGSGSGGSITVSSYTVTGEVNEICELQIDGKAYNIEINSRMLPRYDVSLVGATVSGASSFEGKATQAIGTIVPAAGKTFAGYYYDDDLNIYAANVPAGYNDANLTVYDLATYTLPDHEDSETRSLKLTAMFTDDMLYFAPSDTDGIANKKVGTHKEVDGKVMTEFAWETTEKDTTFQVRTASDTKSHSVNVWAPSEINKETDKSLMVVGIKNTGSEAVTVRYETENYVKIGDMTVTVAAGETVLVPFLYSKHTLVGTKQRGTFTACDHLMTVTSNMTSKATLDFFGYVWIGGTLKVKSFELTSGIEYAPDKPIRLDGTLTVGTDKKIDIYGIKTNLPEGTTINNKENQTVVNQHYVKLNQFGLTNEYTIYRENPIRHDANVSDWTDENAKGWNLFTLGLTTDTSIARTSKKDTDGIWKATYKLNSAKAANSNFTAYASNTNTEAHSNNYNIRIPGCNTAGVKRTVRFIVTNHSTTESLKFSIGPVGGSGSQTVDLLANETKEFVCKNISMGQHQGPDYKVTFLQAQSSGTSFTIYGYFAIVEEDLDKPLCILDNGHIKTEYHVGDKFEVDPLMRVGLVVRAPKYSSTGMVHDPNIIGYATDYDGYIFKASDVGKTFTVTVYQSGMTTQNVYEEAGMKNATTAPKGQYTITVTA